jgi:hypothetical protein
MTWGQWHHLSPRKGSGSHIPGDSEDRYDDRIIFLEREVVC